MTHKSTVRSKFKKLTLCSFSLLFDPNVISKMKKIISSLKNLGDYKKMLSF